MININLNSSKKIYFSSDNHLGAPDQKVSFERELRFISWLDLIKKDAQTIFLLGDLFDFWFEYKQVVPKGYTRLFGKLAELSDSGIEIFFFIGNHDCWVRDYFEKELNIKVLKKPTKFQIDNNKLLIDDLIKKGITNIRAVNRSKKIIKINNDHEIVPSSLNTLHRELEFADIVIASATTDLPLIGKGSIEKALKVRRNKPMLLIDLAVPRNIEEEIKNIEQAYLFSIDDIEKITQDNYGQRAIEAEKALNIIVLESQDALKSIHEKITKDKVQIKLESFLDQLSDEEIKRFKSAEDLKQMIMNLSIIKYEDKSLDEVLDIKNIDNHVIESMFKRYVDNA